jgi:hypothetical protein
MTWIPLHNIHFYGTGDQTQGLPLSYSPDQYSIVEITNLYSFKQVLVARG